MPYATKDSVYVHTVDMSVPSAARTASGNTAAAEVGGLHTARAFLDVTAASGTAPTLDVVLETSHDGTTWRTAKAFGQKTAVSSERLSNSDLDRFVRWRWTIAGTTPSFTFKVDAELV